MKEAGTAEFYIKRTDIDKDYSLPDTIMRRSETAFLMITGYGAIEGELQCNIDVCKHGCIDDIGIR
ncbi:MAG: hypothetical protein JO067_11805 [Cupriavidus sp.]|nr:hypothetical protein [Cupriavidus sp.]